MHMHFFLQFRSSVRAWDEVGAVYRYMWDAGFADTEHLHRLAPHTEYRGCTFKKHASFHSQVENQT